MTRHFWIKILTIVVILLGFSGCAPIATQMPLASTTSSTPFVVVHTLTPTATEVSATSPPSPSSTATLPPPTATPQPTLSAEGMKTVVLELMKDNGGCRLPCLWGLTPGITDIQTLDEFLAQFYDVETSEDYASIEDFDDVGGFSLIFNKDKSHISIDLSYYEDKSRLGLEMLTLKGHSLAEFGNSPEGGLDLRFSYGDALFTQTFQYYTLPNILSTYGPPERVLLATWPDEPAYTRVTRQPFSLVLLYPEQGIFLEYVSLRETLGDHFVGCPAKAHIHLGVWSPEQPLSLKYVVQKAGSEINELNLDYFRSVEEVTSLTLDEFYNIFKDPENTACLETPIDLWKP